MKRYRERRARKRKTRVRIAKLILIIVAVHLIQQTVVIATRVSSESMAPTINERDIVYGSKALYGTRRLFDAIIPGDRPAAAYGPSYGDIVYIYPPGAGTERALPIRFANALVRFFTLQRVTLFDDERVIRRIIALPGDRVRMESFQFFVALKSEERFRSEMAQSAASYQITHRALPSAWEDHYPFSSHFDAYRVPPDRYFVAADNRVGALDSRVWGALSSDRIIAPIILRYRFPFSFAPLL